MKSAVFSEADEQRLDELAQLFRLPTLAQAMTRRLTEAGHAEALPMVLAVFEQEHEGRHQRRVERLRRAAQLPPGKTFATLDEVPLPRALLAKLRELAKGLFLDRATNVLAFGRPGVGKSHALAALGHALIELGHSVFWTPTFRIVQELLAAKRDLKLPQALRRFDSYDALILDDLGYIQQSPEEAEVLFTLMAERYERRSILLSSNLVFSEWERIFKNPMTTLAAIDRLVHHATILEFNPMPSYRGTRAQERAARPSETPATAGQRVPSSTTVEPVSPGDDAKTPGSNE